MKATIAALALVAGCHAVPAAAQQRCYDAVQAIEYLNSKGYDISFGDASGEWKFFMVEDGMGGWVMFALKDDKMCPIASGNFGVHSPKPPNA